MVALEDRAMKFFKQTTGNVLDGVSLPEQEKFV
jgi:hypothetical protein